MKTDLKFNVLLDNLKDKAEVILFHLEAYKSSSQKNLIDNSKIIKICAGKKKDLFENFYGILELPTTLKEINSVVDVTIAKSKFNTNSSIIVKSYLLNKNEKKLSKSDDHITLTEKEIQLIELFLKNKAPISKDNILSSVWNYSSDADTHTSRHIFIDCEKNYR